MQMTPEHIAAVEEAMNITYAEDALRLEAAAYLRSHGWQGMETAPRDGTHILGVNSNGDRAVIFWTGTLWLPSFVHADAFSAAKMWNDDSGAFWSGYAKAWQPLPAAPTQQGDE